MAIEAGLVSSMPPGLTKDEPSVAFKYHEGL